MAILPNAVRAKREARLPSPCRRHVERIVNPTAKKHPTVLKYLLAVQIATCLIGIAWLAVLWFQTYRHRTSQGEQTGG